jgi:hypothetical protein
VVRALAGLGSPWGGRSRAVGQAALVIVISVAIALPAHAQRIERDCSRLAVHQWEELEARLRVLLAGHEAQALSVNLRCDELSAAVALSDVAGTGELPIADAGDLVEGTLSVVEAELARRAAGPSSEPESAVGQGESQTKPATLEHETPELGDPAPPTPAPANAAPRTESASTSLSGGIGLSLGAETWRSATPALGPRLQIALGRGELCVVAVESLAFGRLEPYSALSFSTELGLSWGAPFAAAMPLGAKVLVGYEWLSAAENEAAPAQTSGVMTIALGVQGALNAGPVSLWAGPDLRVRLARSELGPPLSVGLPSYSVLVQAGVFWVQEAMPSSR